MQLKSCGFSLALLFAEGRRPFLDSPHLAELARELLLAPPQMFGLYSPPLAGLGRESRPVGLVWPHAQCVYVHVSWGLFLCNFVSFADT